MRLLSIALFMLPAALASARAPTVVSELPRNVKPSAYRITVTPDTPALRFTGHVSLDVQVLQPTRSVVLQGHEIGRAHV